MAAIPRPSGLQVRHAPGWAYVAVPRRVGFGVEVEQDADGAWQPAHKQGAEWLVPVRQTLRTTIRARYTRSGQVGAWVTGRVWDDGYEEDGDTPPPPPPPPPGSARPVWIRKAPSSAGSTLAVEWEDRGDETQWAVRVDGEPYDYVPIGDMPEFSWAGLPAGEHVVRVRCQVGGAWLPRDTENATTLVVDGHTPPPGPPEAPTGLHVHCLSDRSAKVEWDHAAVVGGWRVWLDGHDDPPVDTITPLVQLSDLTPGAEYTVRVVAYRGDAESDPAVHTFVTLPTVLPPDDTDGADLPAPVDLMVYPVSGSAVEAVWRDDRPNTKPDNFYLASLDGRHWVRLADATVRFVDVASGQHTVHVYGVMGSQLTGIARKAAEQKEAR